MISALILLGVLGPRDEEEIPSEPEPVVNERHYHVHISARVAVRTTRIVKNR
jgi:hypothetical protein